MAKQKYYVIWKGKNPGIYLSWDEAKQQIHGVEGAMYKSFPTMTEAEMAFAKNPWASINKSVKAAKTKTSITGIDYNSICVDAACSGNPGDLEYRGVITSSEKEIFRVGPLRLGTNNIGEFLGIVHGLAYLDKIGRHDIIIYTDSATAISWIKKKKIKTTLVRSSINEPLWELVDRAYDWLNKSPVKNKILKWETKLWGEIKADFGRK